VEAKYIGICVMDKYSLSQLCVLR